MTPTASARPRLASRAALLAAGLGLSLLVVYVPWFRQRYGTIVDLHFALYWPQDILLSLHEYGPAGRRAYLGLLGVAHAFVWALAIWLYGGFRWARSSLALDPPSWPLRALWFAPVALDGVAGLARLVIVARYPHMDTQAAIVAWLSMRLRLPGFVLLCAACLWLALRWGWAQVARRRAA